MQSVVYHQALDRRVDHLPHLSECSSHIHIVWLYPASLHVGECHRYLCYHLNDEAWCIWIDAWWPLTSRTVAHTVGGLRFCGLCFGCLWGGCLLCRFSFGGLCWRFVAHWLHDNKHTCRVEWVDKKKYKWVDMIRQIRKSANMVYHDHDESNSRHYFHRMIH